MTFWALENLGVSVDYRETEVQFPAGMETKKKED